MGSRRKRSKRRSFRREEKKHTGGKRVGVYHEGKKRQGENYFFRKRREKKQVCKLGPAEKKKGGALLGPSDRIRWRETFLSKEKEKDQAKEAKKECYGRAVRKRSGLIMYKEREKKRNAFTDGEKKEGRRVSFQARRGRRSKVRSTGKLWSQGRQWLFRSKKNVLMAGRKKKVWGRTIIFRGHGGPGREEEEGFSLKKKKVNTQKRGKRTPETTEFMPREARARAVNRKRQSEKANIDKRGIGFLRVGKLVAAQQKEGQLGARVQDCCGLESA